MDESKNQPEEKPAASSHIIDLRQRTTSGARPSGRPAQAVPARKSPMSSKPSSAAVAAVASTPELSQPLGAPAKPVSKSVQPAATVPAVTPVSTVRPDVVDAALSKRRFWPAFWRFLVLVIILGVIAVGGVYVYINYLQG